MNKNQQNYKYKYLLNYVVLSPQIILSVQFLILYGFNVINTNLGYMLQYIFKIITGTLFLILFKYVYKKSAKFMIINIIIFSIIFFSHYLVFNENRNFMQMIFFDIFFVSLPSLIYSYSIDDVFLFLKAMNNTAVFIFFTILFTFILNITGIIYVGNYSMSLSYYMLFPTIVFLNNELQKHNKYFLIGTLISLIIIILLGSRGPLLCVIIYTFLFYFRDIKFFNQKILVRNTLFILTFTLLFVTYPTLFNALDSYLTSIGYYSRTIKLIANNNILHLSGREYIYENLIETIKFNPLIGIGITGDRVVNNGAYAHNIILEIISDFGVIIGGILVSILLIVSVVSIFNKDKEIANLLLIWFSIGLVPLLVSGSYLIDFEFWTYIGLSLKCIFNKKS